MTRRRIVSPFRKRPRAGTPEPRDGTPAGPEQSGQPVDGLRGRLSRLFWDDVVIEAARAANVLPVPDRIRLWALVLAARHVPHRLDNGSHGMRILVPSRFRGLAVEEIAAFERENPDLEPEAAPVVPTGGYTAVFWALLALAFAFGLTNGGVRLFGLSHVPWKRLGMADSGLMLDGEWWRTITALTLHADPAHLLANLVLGGVFLLPLVRELGAGCGLLATLVSGALGNACNAALHGPGHLSLGASTAVFGAVGVLAALRAVRGEGEGLRRAFVPVAMGLAFLAFLGTGGERTDLGAHLFGFVSGAGVGVAAGLCIGRWGLPPHWLGVSCAVASLAAPVGAWWLALS